MSELNIGDRVISVVDYPDDNEDIVFGVAGYVCCLDGVSVGICWDERISGGHNCRGHCEHGHGWFMYMSDIAPEPTSDFDAATDDELMTLLGIGGC